MTEFPLFRPRLRKQIAQTELCRNLSAWIHCEPRCAGLDLDPGRRQAPVTGSQWPSLHWPHPARRPSRLHQGGDVEGRLKAWCGGGDDQPDGSPPSLANLVLDGCRQAERPWCRTPPFRGAWPFRPRSTAKGGADERRAARRGAVSPSFVRTGRVDAHASQPPRQVVVIVLRRRPSC